MRKLVIVLIVLLIPLRTVVLAETKNTMGLGVFVGVQIPDVVDVLAVRERFDWTYTILQPTYGWILSERWEIYLEGNIGWYRFDNKYDGTEDDYTLGLSLMAAYDFLKFDKWSTFVELGFGIVYFSGIPEEQGEPLIYRSGFPVLIQVGTGFKFHLGNENFLKLAYRFTHASSISSTEEGGLNTHGVLIAVIKSF